MSKGFVIFCPEDATYHAGGGGWVFHPGNARVYETRDAAHLDRDDCDQEDILDLQIVDVADLEGRMEPTVCPLDEYDCGDPNCDTHHAFCARNTDACWHLDRERITEHLEAVCRQYEAELDALKGRA